MEGIDVVAHKLKQVVDGELVRGCNKTACSYNVNQTHRLSDSVSNGVQDKQVFSKGYACRQGSNDNKYADYFVTGCVASKGVNLNAMFEGGLGGPDGAMSGIMRDPSVGGSYVLTGCRRGQVDPAGFSTSGACGCDKQEAGLSNISKSFSGVAIREKNIEETVTGGQKQSEMIAALHNTKQMFGPNPLRISRLPLWKSQTTDNQYDCSHRKEEGETYAAQCGGSISDTVDDVRGWLGINLQQEDSSPHLEFSGEKFAIGKAAIDLALDGQAFRIYAQHMFKATTITQQLLKASVNHVREHAIAEFMRLAHHVSSIPEAIKHMQGELQKNKHIVMLNSEGPTTVDDVEGFYCSALHEVRTYIRQGDIHRARMYADCFAGTMTVLNADRALFSSDHVSVVVTKKRPGAAVCPRK